MIKHTIVYDDNKGILVVIMPVYAIEEAILVAAAVVKIPIFSLYPYSKIRTGSRVGKVGMGSILVPSIFNYWGSRCTQIMLVQMINDRLNIACHVGNILFLLSRVSSCNFFSFPD